MNVRGLRATVMGLGRHGGGVAAARFLAEQGAVVTVTDSATADDLAESVAALADVPIRAFHFGGHCEEDFRTAELLVVNPAVKPENRYVRLARDSGARLTSEIELFLERCPAPVIAVTGSNGKSTTAAMTAAILNASGRRTWLGGNIGRSLLPDLPQMRPDDSVVLEISSFQSYWLGAATHWPHIVAVTNFAPNHLDWHGTIEHYRRAKQRLIAEQPATGIAIFDERDPSLSTWRVAVRGTWRGPLADEAIPALRLPGPHNRANAALAAATATAAGANSEAIVRGLAHFSGLPHRLQVIAEFSGRRFYDDSKATTPEAAMAALAAMDRPTWILLGGSDKRVDFSALASFVGGRARGAAVYGAVGEALDESLARHAPQLPRFRGEALDEALRWCWTSSSPGDSILLSPACASHDQFRDYIDRGEHFARLVVACADETVPPPNAIPPSMLE